jgi:large subunit ribosomal protein L23
MKSPYSIIGEMILSEKLSALTEKYNQYCFKVDLKANKIEIKKAVEDIFKVHVIKVNTLNRAGKPKRERTMTYGRTAKSKRALVTLKEGETIDLA